MLRQGIRRLKNYVYVYTFHASVETLFAIGKDDVVRYMLSMPIMSGRIGKWILALSEFDLHYESAKAVKGQIMADFVTQHCGIVGTLEIVPWTLFFDGSTCDRGQESV